MNTANVRELAALKLFQQLAIPGITDLLKNSFLKKEIPHWPPCHFQLLALVLPFRAPQNDSAPPFTTALLIVVKANWYVFTTTLLLRPKPSSAFTTLTKTWSLGWLFSTGGLCPGVHLALPEDIFGCYNYQGVLLASTGCGQKCCKESHKIQDSSHNKELSGPKTSKVSGPRNIIIQATLPWTFLWHLVLRSFHVVPAGTGPKTA